MTKLNQKIKASIMLASYLDTLGYKNGEWEFNFNLNINEKSTSNVVWLYIVHQYFALGGSNIDISKWDSSDDTILMLATAKACMKGGKEIDYINEYKKVLSELEKDKRGSGLTTIKSLRYITKVKQLHKLKYLDNMGGNGAAMRTSIIGIIYHSEKDLEKLIEQSILAGRITHNYSLGFLGGLVTALFTSYAIRGIEPWKWIKHLLELEKSGKIDHIIKKTNIYDNYLNDKEKFWNRWYQYNENRLPKRKYNSSKFVFPLERLTDIESYTPGITRGETTNNYSKFGASGIGAVIVAYDSLLLSLSSSSKHKFLPLDKPTEIKYNWDSLVFFSALHFGDNDTVGTIAGAWYGALRGFDGINEDKMKQLEFYTDLNKVNQEVLKLF